MPRLVLRVRPLETMGDLDVGAVREHAARLEMWEAEVRDTRLSDAPFVTVVVAAPGLTPEALASLKAGFTQLPRVRVVVWLKEGVESPLETADLAALAQAAASYERTRGTYQAGA
jgi:hypothetical protein